ncbi:trypsin 3A1-like [Helicoverpa zea]|uniref:trypsin 3A1-like n=1 Tax=Helicoverpa zea TaxID=7113 RepID=UPI001F581ABB|nr:trypsin 3A1-like [Helicoverpa zea]
MGSFVILFSIAVSVIVAVSSNAVDSTRIVGGFVSPEGGFKYMVSLQELSKIQNYRRGHRCGGALISYQHALTAASCTFNENNGAFTSINVAEFRMFAGSVLLTNDTSEDRVRSIANITVHPSYLTSRPFTDDIAVITLTVPFPNNVVKPVPLSEREVSPQEIGACTLSGWGSQNSSATESAQLIYSSQTIFDWNACVLAHSILPPPLVIQPSMICAYPHNSLSVGCTGDIGNPLVCHDSLTGIAAKTQNCIQPPMPEVYTKVSTYIPWINRVMNGAPSIMTPGIALMTTFVVIASKIIT